MMSIILGSLQTAQILRFRGSFGYLGTIIPVQAHVDSSSLFPALGAAGSYSKKSSKYPKYTLQNTEGGSTGTKGISLPSQCTAWVFSFLNFNPKRQQIFVWRSLKIDKDTIYPFLFLISHWTTAVQIFSLDQSNICILGNSDLQIKSEIMPQYFP